MRPLLLGLVALGSLAAWAPSSARAEAEPLRVATLLPYVDDALARMPAPRVRVVATVRRSMHEAARAGVVDLGTPHAPSLESLAVARPDVVVGDVSMHARLAENVAPLGAELLLLDSSSVAATFEGLERLAVQAGVAAEMQREIDASRAALAQLALDAPVPTLALFGTAARWLVVTERSWLGDLLGALRFDSVSKHAGGAERIPGYAEISDEQIATTRPALVLVVTHGDPRAIRATLDAKIGAQGAWSGIAQSAVDGVHVLDPGLFTVNPGLALPDAARALVALANGETATAPAVGAQR
ncbi:MAG: ABC transporter substrate-binding protein [Myxococcota bacterium]|jgi:iron complex transport system substrate-binding protein|nr:ABC transporter substrate-binding protein [Myxococcota bacterium]